MRKDYRDWLEAAGYVDTTRATQVSEVQKVEKHYGDLDEIIANGGYASLIEDLTYSMADQRKGTPNPSRIPVNGNIYNNLQSYKSAVARYRRFLQEISASGSAGGSGLSDAAPESGDLPSNAALALPAAAGVDVQRLALERDMQMALRRDIAALEPGLAIIDDGAERSVTSGFIDILCEDRQGRLVVVELKAGTTDARVIGQTLGYMGDLMDEDDTRSVRGIIVAHRFDQRTKSAARAISNLSLFAYSVAFTFMPEG